MNQKNCDAKLPEDLAAEICRLYQEVKAEEADYRESCDLENRASDMSLSLTVWIRLKPIQRFIIMEHVGYDSNLTHWQKKCQQLILEYTDTKELIE